MSFLAIAEASEYVPLHRRATVRHRITTLLQESQLFTTEVSDHPLGVGIFGFVDSFMRDNAVNTPLELEDEDLLITFVPHNEALNRRTTTFGPAVWLMYFGFPYDYQTQHYMHKSVDKFGSLVEWHNPRSDRRFVLLKARVIHLRLVPKSIVMRQIGGARHCWMIAVTMLRSSDWNAHLPEVPPTGKIHLLMMELSILCLVKG